MIFALVLLVPISDHDAKDVFAIDATKSVAVGVLILNDATRSFKILYLLDWNIERL